jgi:hypothetical protein
MRHTITETDRLLRDRKGCYDATTKEATTTTLIPVPNVRFPPVADIHVFALLQVREALERLRYPRPATLSLISFS